MDLTGEQDAADGPSCWNDRMTMNPEVPAVFDLMTEASQRLVRTVDGLSEEQLSDHSLLTGWTRAHVAAHLALNALALEGVLNGVAANNPVPMYPSQDVRNQDIEDLAAAGPSEVRSQTLRSVSCFAAAAEDFPQDKAEEPVERVPGGTTFPAGAALSMRWREVEIHHADLGAGYSHHDWPLEFAEAAITHLTSDGSGRSWTSSFRVFAHDSAQSWQVGDDNGLPLITVTGSAADVAWWLSGRGAGEGLTTDRGELPEVPSL